MRILHTSDWHLGRTLCRRQRYDEFEAFLDWLAQVVREQHVDVLLVAGDVFDTSTPSNRAQALYYRFLCQVANSPCRHVVVIAGNHDSPSFLNAPKELLKALHVHVIGHAAEDPQDEVLELMDEDGATELIVCAVPYLRDRDIRTAEAGERVEDKERKLIEGIRRHYADVVAAAEQKRKNAHKEIPLIGMGHLFTAGGLTVDGDGVRQLYVGSLAHVNPSIFPANLDYVALGHLHVPQRVVGSQTVRYSGSPMAMGFGEANQPKSVSLVEIRNRKVDVQLIDVPVFKQLERVSGDLDQILSRLAELAAADSAAWLEVVYLGDTMMSDLQDRLHEAIEGSGMEILRVKSRRISDQALTQMADQEALDELSVEDVFERCLTAHQVTDPQRTKLRHAYQQVVTSIDED